MWHKNGEITICTSIKNKLKSYQSSLKVQEDLNEGLCEFSVRVALVVFVVVVLVYICGKMKKMNNERMKMRRQREDKVKWVK